MAILDLGLCKVSPILFNGDFNCCRGFLAQCELLFTHQPSRYSSYGSRIALVMSLLVDEALSLAIAAIEGNNALATNYSLSKREFQTVFDHPVDGKDAASHLLVICQRSCTVAQYTPRANGMSMPFSVSIARG